MRRAPATALGLVAVVGFALSGAPLAADERVPYTVEVEDASAKVGEPTVVRAKVSPPEDYHVTKSYRIRVIKLSAADDGVEFADEVVRGWIEDGSAVFDVAVTPTKPGPHPINGVIRVSFHNSNGHSEAKSVPLMATVTGTE